MKPIRVLAVVAVALVAAVVLNPSAERHRDAVRRSVADSNPLAGALGLGKVTAFVSTYHSLGVASYTTVDKHVLSVGVFGYVHVRPLVP